jgi:type I restriction enzyme S subunit
VEGRLTEEWRKAHPEVEPATILLENIRETKTDFKQLNFENDENIELSSLPISWIWTRLGQIFDVYVGATPRRNKPEYWGGDIPWVSSGEVAFCRIYKTRETISKHGFENSSTKIHPPGTVLLGMIGEGKTRGQAAILNIAACNNQNSAAIRVSEVGFPPEYLYYYLEHEYERTRKLSSGNNQPALNKNRVQSMHLPLPSLVEQQKIVEEIERCLSVNEEIENAINESLQRANRLRQSILKRAFEGRLVSQDTNDEPASQLLERIRSSKNNSTQKIQKMNKIGTSIKSLRGV